MSGLGGGAYDAVVVGAGPNGLTAGIVLARRGLRVLLIEASAALGGGLRSAELTAPGFVHDVCATVHPLGVASPLLRVLPLQDFGLRWVQPEAPLAHPLDGQTAVMLERSLEATAAGLGPDAAAYRRLMEPLVQSWPELLEDMLGPLPLPPRHPWMALRFGVKALQSASGLARRSFRGERAQALFAGLAAHAILPLEAPATSAYALMLGALAHAVGWPLAQGGSQAVAAALAGYFRSLGGEIMTGWRVERLEELPSARVTLLDVTPRALLKLAGERLPAGYRRALGRFRYGAGVFKLDYALEGPMPWRDPAVGRAATVHLGGTLAEVAASEARLGGGAAGGTRPFVLAVQPTLFDPGRAPQGRHILWAYAHVPHGSREDLTEAIEAQIERAAPGWRRLVWSRFARGPAELEAYNPNYVGGDISGGAQDIWQIFTRPTWSLKPYRTALAGVYLCSSSTPPGGGVHGMCGFHAAETAWRDWFGRPRGAPGGA